MVVVCLGPSRGAADPWGAWSVSPVTTVVHGCTGRDGDMTVVNGEILVKEGRLCEGSPAEEVKIIRMAQEAVEGLPQRFNDGREQGQEIGGKLMSPCNYI